MPADKPPFALYIHWPFCVSKCPYCDFNSHVRDHVDKAAWAAALLKDLAHEATLLPKRTLGSIFFGGGTPSLMPPATVAALIDAATQAWTPASDIEITLEANPSSVESARFHDLAAVGVNRISLGLQALNDEALAFLGRAHGVREGLAALDIAQRNFDRVSFDLIYARPNQSVPDWEDELSQALRFGTEHLSLYQLTIEAGTRFATLAQQGKLLPVDPDHGADLYESTRNLTAAARLPAYEVSNHARVGAESRHNLTYWRYQDYAGIGPGAHGRRAGLATVRHKKPENFMSAVARNGQGLQSETALSADEQLTEALLMGLRLREGVDLARFACGDELPPQINRAAADRTAALGLITISGARLVATAAGMLVLDAILPQLLGDAP
jgi:putative oxygen-independent coproporphyrinogen III oxidase